MTFGSPICCRQTRGMLVLLCCLTCAVPCCFAAPDDVEPVDQVQAQGEFNIDESNFDQWIFQGNGNAANGKARLVTRLNLQLAEIDRLCGLTTEQKEKLQLAARGDTKRFFDEVEVVRQKFLAVRHDQNAFGQIWQDIQPLQRRVSLGLHGETSIFHKALRRTLNDEQMERYQNLLDERRKYRYRASIEVALTSIEHSVPLKHSQHEAIVKLMLDETPTPLAFGQYDQYLILHQLSKLGETRVKPLLDERQWKLMSVNFDQARGMEQFLIQQGLLPKVEVGEIRPAGVGPVNALNPENVIRAEPAAENEGPQP